MGDDKKLKIAILGATGYIGRALLYEFQKDSKVQVIGYSRDVEVAKKTLGDYKVVFDNIRTYGQLMNEEYDIIINATGIGSPKKLNSNPSAVFEVTEQMDHMVFQYLDKYPKTRIFNLSSGAIYGLSAGDYVAPNSVASFPVNSLNAKDGYALAKLHSEVRHRTKKEFFIVDLRVFAFVSRFLDTEDSFLVSEIAKCLKEDTELKTKSGDIVRDFTTASDIVSVVRFLMSKEPLNDVFDMRSVESVSKHQLLNKLNEELGLKYVVEDMAETSPTGTKNVYAPSSSRLESLGHKPQHSSLENVTEELKAFLSL